MQPQFLFDPGADRVVRFAQAAVVLDPDVRLGAGVLRPERDVPDPGLALEPVPDGVLDERLKEQAAINALAAAIAEKVVVLDAISCCGFAGDKGLFLPELNEHATRFGKAQIPPDCRMGISTVSTCATGLSERMDIPFFSIASVLEMVSAAQR